MRCLIWMERYKDMSWEEGGALEKQGIDVEMENYWADGYLDISEIKAMTKSWDDNIKVWFSTGDSWILQFTNDLWMTIARYLENKSAVATYKQNQREISREN